MKGLLIVIAAFVAGVVFMLGSCIGYLYSIERWSRDCDEALQKINHDLRVIRMFYEKRM